MELAVLSIFCITLLLCVLWNVSILYALVFGLLLFWFYGRRKGFCWHELIGMSLSGIRTVRNILITFILIGMLTALWRAAGTIPVIVCYAGRLIRPGVFFLMTFLLNCLVSVLTGTAFGTAATMGVICSAIAAAMNCNMILTGGAVLSGVFFGDRCSPVSTSALLVSELTGTNIFENIRHMLKTAFVPFVLTCIVYFLAGFSAETDGQAPDLHTLFSREITLHWAALLPALVILVLALFCVRVKTAMSVSILSALPVCVLLQHIPAESLPALMLFGYRASDPALASMLNGGGILSMAKVAAIVCLSASYSGIFQKTGLLDQIKHQLKFLSEQTTSGVAVLCTGIVSGMIACNQSLAIMLTHQLCCETEPDTDKFAVLMEDTVVVIAPLVPWSIAGGVPLASIGAPVSSVLCACFLYLLPVCTVTAGLLQKHRQKKA